MLMTFATLIRRDLLLAWRRKSDLLVTVSFFVMVATLFPLGVGPEPALLKAMAPGVVWVAALLAALLAQARLFEADYADGTLEQMLLVPEPPSLLVLAKVTAHWLVSGFPVLLLTPILALQFGLTWADIYWLCLALLIGTPVLSLVGAVGAALTLGLRNPALLAMIVTLPLLIPVLIFGAGVTGASNPQAPLQMLAALLAASLALTPWAAAAALRISIE